MDKIKKYLDEVAYIGKSKIENDDGDIYYSKFDDSYITRVGMEETVRFLSELKITDELSHGTGFCPDDKLWYGWSHRAIYGFTIGSTCKKGDCHYRASSVEEELEAAILFWRDEDKLNIKSEVLNDSQIKVSWTYSENIPNEKMRRQPSGATWLYDKNNFGKGEWVAKTIEDAKQMAIDFNKGVS